MASALGKDASVRRVMVELTVRPSFVEMDVYTMAHVLLGCVDVLLDISATTARNVSGALRGAGGGGSVWRVSACATNHMADRTAVTQW